MELENLIALFPKIMLLGSILSLAVLGFGFSLRVLAYADLTLEGSFVLGAAAAAVVTEHEMCPLWTIPLALGFGASAGLMTACQHCFLRVNKLLSGIISFAILYSLNLRILGTPNMSFFGRQGIFELTSVAAGPYLICGIIVAVVFLITARLLASEMGLFMRAYGENPSLVKRAGYSQTPLILIGLAFSNALIALSGALFSQYSGYVDVGMGTGMLVICLTALVLGEMLIRPKTITGFLLVILLGTGFCQLLQAACLQFNLRPADYKGVLGIGLVLLVFSRKLMIKRAGESGFGADVL